MACSDIGGLQSEQTTAVGTDILSVRMGSGLRALRIDRKISLLALAEATGITPVCLATYESGTSRISAEDVYLLANALETTIQALFGEDCR